MKIHKSTLSNGLRIILAPIKEFQSATTLVMVGAGSRYENRKNNGISHFLEHMAFKGTKKYPTAMEIATLLDGIGAESNAFTHKEFTGFYIRSASNHMPLSLDILSDYIKNPLIDPKEIDKERGVIIGEIDLYEDTPMRNIGDVFERLIFGDIPLGWDIAGTKDVIRSVKREDFISYMKSLYSAKNMVVVIAGNIDEQKGVEEIKMAFADTPTFKSNKFEKSAKAIQKHPQISLKSKKTEQAHLALGVTTTGLTNDDEKYKLMLLSAILGGGMSSRLFHEVREKRGLGYYVRSYSEQYIDAGYLASFAGVDPQKIDEAIKVIKNEYEKVLKKGEITDKELEKAKEYIKGHFILSLEETKSVAGYFATDEILLGKTEDPSDVIKKIKKVSLDEILATGRKYLKMESLNLAIIGNFEDKDRFLKLLG